MDSQWISCEEKLPTESDRYLCYCFNGDYWCQEVNFFDREIKRFCNYDEDVRFWRELPEPPNVTGIDYD